MKRSEALAVAKPILFNTEMVMAILDGRKSVTRRTAFPNSVCGMVGSYKTYYCPWCGARMDGKDGE